MNSFNDNILIKRLLFSLSLMTFNSSASEVLTVIHPINNENATYRERDQYFINVLKLALDSVDIQYQLVTNPVITLPENRSIRLLNDGYYNVHWLSTNANKEKKLLPIKIPLEKGLIGWRLMLIHQDNTNHFSKSTTIDNIKKLTAGSGHDWPDTQIFRENQFKVFTSNSTVGLQKMLNLKRIDYFPRSIMEIWQEHRALDFPSLVIDPNIAIVYPAAVYFFVAKNNKALGLLIEKGLEIALKNGSFEELFYQHYGDVIKKSKLENRKIYRIENSFMNNDRYINHNYLWFTPNK